MIAGLIGLVVVVVLYVGWRITTRMDRVVALLEAEASARAEEQRARAAFKGVGREVLRQRLAQRIGLVPGTKG